MAGKGDKPRPVDAGRYGKNYDAVFRNFARDHPKCETCEQLNRLGAAKWSSCSITDRLVTPDVDYCNDHTALAANPTEG